MPLDCFYKCKVTKNNKTDVYHYGYMTWKSILQDVKNYYKDGADAVELEMISKKSFDKRMEPYSG